MGDVQSKIPGFPFRLLSWLMPFTAREGCSGDIEEEFEERLRLQGRRSALRRIWFHEMIRPIRVSSKRRKTDGLRSPSHRMEIGWEDTVGCP